MTLYTKTECGLCEEAEAALQRLQRVIQFDLEHVDIETDSQAYDRYWDRVPVVVVDGREVAAGRIDQDRLRAFLAG